MLFYVPPLLPLIGKNSETNSFEVNGSEITDPVPQLTDIDNLRMPIKFMANFPN